MLTYLVCIPLGIAKALRHRQAFDAVSSLVVFAAYAIPSFALAMLLKTMFCGTVEGLFDVFPIGGIVSDFDVEPGFWTRLADRAWHMVLPVACYVAGSFAMLTLLMKNSLLDQIAADYVRTVIAKGATRRRAVWGHTFIDNSQSLRWVNAREPWVYFWKRHVKKIKIPPCALVVKCDIIPKSLSMEEDSDMVSGPRLHRAR